MGDQAHILVFRFSGGETDDDRQCKPLTHTFICSKERSNTLELSDFIYLSYAS
jgi:hypothetical protein